MSRGLEMMRRGRTSGEDSRMTANGQAQQRHFVRGWGALGLWLGIVLLASLAAPVQAVVTVRVNTTDAFTGDESTPPAPATMTVRLERERESEVVATVNFDLIFQVAQFDLRGVCEDNSSCQFSSDCPSNGTCRLAPLHCQKDPRLADHLLEVVPPDFQNVRTGDYRVRFALVTTTFSNPLPVIPDGTLLTCSLPLAASVTPGPQVVRYDRLQVADNKVPAVAVDSRLVLELGEIIAGPARTPTLSPTPTPSETPGTPTPTATETETAIPTPTTPAPSPTPTTVRTPCPSPRPSPVGAAVYVEDAVLLASGPITLTVRLATGGQQIVATQNDLVLGAGIRVNANASGRPDCTANPALNKNGSSFAFLPPGCAPDACTSVRAVVVSLENVDPIPDGSVLYTCNATLSDVEARVDVTGVGASDAEGNPVPGVAGRNGFLCVEPPPTPTPTITATRTASPTTPPVEASPTATRTATPTTPVVIATPTRTPTTAVGSPTPTRTGAPAAGNGDGCDCNVSGARGGWSSIWLLLPVLALRWWRRSAMIRRALGAS
jgi:hypothetical protein